MNMLLIEHAFRNQVHGDESMKNKLKMFQDEQKNDLEGRKLYEARSKGEKL